MWHYNLVRVICVNKLSINGIILNKSALLGNLGTINKQMKLNQYIWKLLLKEEKNGWKKLPLYFIKDDKSSANDRRRGVGWSGNESNLKVL